MAEEDQKTEGEDTGTEGTQEGAASEDDEVQEEADQTQPVITEPVHPVAPPPALAPIEVASIQEEQKATVSAPVAAPAQSPDGTITLSTEAFQALMSRLGKLEENSKLLEQVQDRNTIAKIERLRAEGKLVKSVKVRKIGEKYVVGWQTLEDEVYHDENGRVIAKQTVKIFFHDATEKIYTMRQWATAGDYIPFEVTGETKDADGNLFFKTVGPDGLTLQLNATFIN